MDTYGDILQTFPSLSPHMFHLDGELPPGVLVVLIALVAFAILFG